MGSLRPVLNRLGSPGFCTSGIHPLRTFGLDGTAHFAFGTSCNASAGVGQIMEPRGIMVGSAAVRPGGPNLGQSLGAFPLAQTTA